VAVRQQIVERFDELLAEAQGVEGTHVAVHVPHEWGSRSGARDGHVDGGTFTHWHVSALSLVRQIAGESSPHYVALSQGATYLPSFRIGVAALRAARDDYARGFLRDFAELAAAEVFDDFLEMAQHLSGNGYEHAAASVSGAVLEDALRRLHAKKIGPWCGDSSITKLNDALRKAEAYAQPQWRLIQHWGDLRNAADHGEFDKVDADDVKRMVGGIRDFIAKHTG